MSAEDVDVSLSVTFYLRGSTLPALRAKALECDKDAGIVDDDAPASAADSYTPAQALTVVFHQDPDWLFGSQTPYPTNPLHGWAVQDDLGWSSSGPTAVEDSTTPSARTEENPDV